MSLKWLINFVNSVQLRRGNLVKCQHILSHRPEDKKLKYEHAFLMNAFSYMERRYVFPSHHKGSAVSVMLLLGQALYYMAVLHLKITEINKCDNRLTVAFLCVPASFSIMLCMTNRDDLNTNKIKKNVITKMLQIYMFQQIL